MVRIQKKGFLYQLTFMPVLFPVNCYIVEEEKTLTLVDAALPFSVKSIMEMVKKLEKPLTAIVLTHAHEDHVGAVDSLKSFLPDVPVYLSARDALLLDGNLLPQENEPPKKVKGGVPKKMQTRPDFLLKEGDRIGSLEAVFTPGHTPGSMSFFNHRNRQVLAGDAFQTRGGVAVSGTFKPMFPFPAFATWDKETAIKSAEKLENLQPALLAAGHGNMIENPAYEINRAIGEAKRKTKVN